jgi:hypothetical protein
MGSLMFSKAVVDLTAAPYTFYPIFHIQIVQLGFSLIHYANLRRGGGASRVQIMVSTAWKAVLDAVVP